MAIPQRKGVSAQSGLTKYGNGAKFADPVNHKYPLDTPAHIYFGQERKEGEQSPGRAS